MPKLVRKAVNHLSKASSEEDQITIKHCRNDEPPEEKVLAIGECESAWLADLAGACIPDNTKQHFRKTKFHILQMPVDGDLATFNNNLFCGEMFKGRTKF